MTVLNHSYDEALKRFLTSAPRYRVAVLKVDSSTHEKNALNIGRALAEVIKPMDRKNDMVFQFSVQEAVFKTIKDHTKADPELGDIVILENLGILFESELHVDITDVLRKVSRNTLVVLLWPGEIGKDQLSFYSPKYCIKQSEINYIIL